MNGWIDFIMKFKKSVFIFFIGVAALSTFFALYVMVNYKMVDYLPEDASSTVAMKVMDEEFGTEMANARIMINNTNVEEALEYKTNLQKIEGISSVSWLDDIVGSDVLLVTPIEYLDKMLLDAYFKNNNALFSIIIESGKEKIALDGIYDLIGKENAVSGEAINIAETQNMSVNEVMKAMFILLPIIILLLIISTTSWVEPILFLLTIGIAIIINMGTNIIFGNISFITQSVSPILQLAVSLDYAIFLLHSFAHFRKEDEPEAAMKKAIKKSFPIVAASAATTVIGFSALIFMRFGIGSDLGINLMKGILISFITVMICLPVLTLLCTKLIDKTTHKKLLPNFKRIAPIFMKIRIPCFIVAALIFIPCFIAQGKNEFLYGMGSVVEHSRVGKDTAAIEETFGKENPLVVLVPKGNMQNEMALLNEFFTAPHVAKVVALATSIAPDVPMEYVPEEVMAQFYSNNYCRMILYLDTAEEGKEAFEAVEGIKEITLKYYDTFHILGQSAILYDMKEVVSLDIRIVNLIAVIGIFLVLLITFKSLTLPIFLLFTIETAIWISLSFSYFSSQPISFIGYLIISTVQLGATVDYAILFAGNYMTNRKTMYKKEAMTATIGEHFISILISATILGTAGFALAFTSTNMIISELGMLLGRGTILSLVMVSCVLPAILVLFDTLIRKTSMNCKFLVDKK